MPLTFGFGCACQRLSTAAAALADGGRARCLLAAPMLFSGVRTPADAVSLPPALAPPTPPLPVSSPLLSSR